MKWVYLPKKMGCIVGIDYGSKRTGLATTDPHQIIASSLVSLPTNEVLSYLEDYCKVVKVDIFVVGKPIQKDGLPSAIESEIELFVYQLKELFSECSVERYDERFTSKIAAQTLLQTGIKKKQRRDKSILDRISATLLLQSYLDFKSNVL
jgi:putative Holliday junction resolvase